IISSLLRMISGIVKAVVLLLLVSSVSSSCSCSRSPSLGLSVNCSSQDLYHIPDFPSNTTELYLQHNRLATVPPGFFDKFSKLRVVDLSENPFHCSCDVQYLRSWLLRNRDLTAGSPPTCSSPVSRAHRAIISLGETEFSSCMKKSCSGTVSNLVLVFLLCGVLGLLVWSLCLAKGLGVTLGIGEKHGSFQTESLRSLKPKHRATVKYLSQWSEDLETPLLNMDILPQILDTLHKHHNIKIKDS
ncbi:platelet glycoprotein IX, partial [Silurus meridionalis]